MQFRRSTAPDAIGRPRSAGCKVRAARWAAVLLPSFVLLVGAQAKQTCAPGIRSAPGADTRFEAREDGTIVDRRARLMWMRCSAGQIWSGKDCLGDASTVDFEAALSMVADLNRSGARFFSDWRLPRVPELAAIAERDCAEPRIDLAAFPDTPAAFYWTTTTRPGAPGGFAFALSFGAEGIRYLDKAEPSHVRLVRDAR